MKEDPYNLNRLIIMQDVVYESVIQELRVGRKETHWIWFVFPQYRGGLDISKMAQEYAIQSIDEVRAPS